MKMESSILDKHPNGLYNQHNTKNGHFYNTQTTCSAQGTQMKERNVCSYLQNKEYSRFRYKNCFAVESTFSKPYYQWCGQIVICNALCSLQLPAGGSSVLSWHLIYQSRGRRQNSLSMLITGTIRHVVTSSISASTVSKRGKRLLKPPCTVRRQPGGPSEIGTPCNRLKFWKRNAPEHSELDSHLVTNFTAFWIGEATHF